MRYLKYTMPSEPHRDFDMYPGTVYFDLYPGTFFFRLPAMITAYSERIESEVKHDHPHMKLEYSPIYRQHIAKVELLKWLESVNEGDREVVECEGSIRDPFWCSKLVFGGDYRDVVCPACEASYSPGNTTKLKWQYGEFLAAEGGHRLVCPKQHTLFKIGEWIS
jgi:hypothetical protein